MREQSSVSPQRWGACLLTCSVLASIVQSSSQTLAQEFNPVAPPLSADSSQRLMMEQVDELISSGETLEAIDNLEKLFDQGQAALVELAPVQVAGTLSVRRYQPLRAWTRARLEQLLIAESEATQDYRRRMDGAAKAALADVQLKKDLALAEQSAQRFKASGEGARLNLLLADLYLERGWVLAAIQAAENVVGCSRVTDGTKAGSPAGLSWRCLFSGELGNRPAGDQAAGDQVAGYQAAMLEQLHEAGLNSDADSQTFLEAAYRRFLIAAAMDPKLVDQAAVTRWVRTIADALGAETSELKGIGNRLEAFAVETLNWPSLQTPTENWTTFGGDDNRTGRTQSAAPLVCDFSWPKWNQVVEAYTANSDRTDASKPRVGESERATLPYHPVVVDGIVYFNAMNQILAFDLQSGKPWPDISSAQPLFDSQVRPARYVPLGYPLVGTPRGTLCVEGDCLYARMGSPVTGWANRVVGAVEGSTSYLVGLNLAQQGSLMRGFPLRLTAPDFPNAEFEGAPLVWGDLLIAAIVSRDNVGLTRSVAAFDRFSGALVWKSGPLASGTVHGSEQANLISQQMLSLAGGRLYYSTNLGAVACLNPLDGRVLWLSSYSRPDRLKARYPNSARYRYRDVTPCLVSHGLVYCAPNDCPEIFALDAITGDLVWSTNNEEVADANQVLGIQGDSLVVSGDRLVWLDRSSGQLLSRFPSATTPGIINALPSPRGLGRGLIAGGEVYWPVSGEIFVLQADAWPLPQDSGTGLRKPQLLGRHALDVRGADGGNLVASQGWLLYASPSRILAFEPATLPESAASPK